MTQLFHPMVQPMPKCDDDKLLGIDSKSIINELLLLYVLFLVEPWFVTVTKLLVISFLYVSAYGLLKEGSSQHYLCDELDCKSNFAFSWVKVLEITL